MTHALKLASVSHQMESKQMTIKLAATAYTNEVVLSFNSQGFALMVFAQDKIHALVGSKQVGLTFHSVNRY